MAPLNSEKFHIRNLDCATCAAKLERGLNQIDGIQEANIDFANLILHVKTIDIDRVITGAEKIDTDIELIPHEKYAEALKEAPQSSYRPKKEVVLLAAASILFVLELFIEHRFEGQADPFIELPIVLAAFLLAGWNVIRGALRTIGNRIFFDENVLMVIATTGAIAIQAYSEAVAVMIFYKIGELLQEMAVSRSRRSIRALLSLRPDKALVKTENGWLPIPPEQVAAGSEIQIKPGEKIPLDGEIIEGTSQIDTSPITGEFRPRRVTCGDTIMAGQINQTGLITARVIRPFAQSSIAKVMDLVENAAARKANTEKFITTFARYYTPAVVLIAAAIALVPPLFFAEAFEDWIYRALVLLVISCPCALVVSIPLGYFGGIGRASASGILVKGSNFIDALAKAKTVVFDKTGTLTQGVFKVKSVETFNGYSQNELLEFSAAAEHHSSHPIAASISEAFEATGGKLLPEQITNHMEISGEGVRAQYQGKSILVGNDHMLHREQVVHGRCDFDTTVVHVAVDGKYAGYLMIGDQVKKDAPTAVKRLRQEGIEQIIMLTGDNRCAAEAVATYLQLDDFQAELLPEEKVSRFEEISRKYRAKGKIAFVGDGINDAPTIARADVGVAMGALGADAAIETADVVLMSDSPSKMAQAVSIAKQTRTIVWQNIVLAFSIKIFFILLGAMGLASMWFAVFADVGTALLAVLNSTRILKGEGTTDKVSLKSP